MSMIRLPFIFLSVFLSSCALLSSASFESDVVVKNGKIKRYELILKGKRPNMVHDESQMFWPTYHDVFYKIHIDQLSGELTENSFKITYKNKLQILKSYFGSITLRGNNLIVNLRNCPHQDSCFNAVFNGSYKLKNKI